MAMTKTFSQAWQMGHMGQQMGQNSYPPMGQVVMPSPPNILIQNGRHGNSCRLMAIAATMLTATGTYIGQHASRSETRLIYAKGFVSHMDLNAKGSRLAVTIAMCTSQIQLVETFGLEYLLQSWARRANQRLTPARRVPTASPTSFLRAWSMELPPMGWINGSPPLRLPTHLRSHQPSHHQQSHRQSSLQRSHPQNHRQ